MPYEMLSEMMISFWAEVKQPQKVRTNSQNALLKSGLAWLCLNYLSDLYKITKHVHHLQKTTREHICAVNSNSVSIFSRSHKQFDTFAFSLCVFLYPVPDLFHPFASPLTFPYFCVCFCASSQPQEYPKGLVEGDWGCAAPSSCCGLLSKTWLETSGKILYFKQHWNTLVLPEVRK